jgi:hypothetical protein
MSDTAIAETPSSPPAPEVVEPHFSPDLGETTPEAAVPAGTALPPEVDAPALPGIEYPIGPTRQAVLDHMVDSEGDQSMAQIKAGLANVLPGTVEVAVRREWEQGRLLRVAPSVYRMAPPKPPEAPKPAPPPEPEPVRSDGHTNEEWFAALEAYLLDPESWDIEKWGPPLDQSNHRIPWDIAMRFSERLRKREERRRDREAAAARQAAADAELRDKLIAAAGGNVVRGPGIEDLAPIRAAMEFVPLDRILTSIRDGLRRLMCPASEPATSWREPRLLKRIAQDYCQFVLVPAMVDDWDKASAKAPEKPVQKLKPLAGTSSEPATPQAAPATRAYVTCVNV